MSKKDEEEFIPKNDTLAALLRKSEDGDFINFAGGETQALLAKLRAAAARKGGAVAGRINIELKISMGRDGYAQAVASIKTKAPEVRRRDSTLFVDEDGDLMSRPVEKQLGLTGLDGGAAAPTKDPVQPAAKSL